MESTTILSYERVQYSQYNKVPVIRNLPPSPPPAACCRHPLHLCSQGGIWLVEARKGPQWTTHEGAHSIRHPWTQHEVEGHEPKARELEERRIQVFVIPDPLGHGREGSFNRLPGLHLDTTNWWPPWTESPPFIQAGETLRILINELSNICLVRNSNKGPDLYVLLLCRKWVSWSVSLCVYREMSTQLH